GVPFGANRPTQIDASRSGMPASRGVAHDGSSGDFLAVVMPMTLPRPDLMCGAAPGTAITPNCTSPAATAAAAGAPPLYGTCSSWIPAACASHSPARWLMLPLPAEPKLIAPGLAFACATSSLKLLNGAAAFAR